MGCMRVIAARILFVLGTGCLVLGLFAGLLNREVIDSERFARHVDSVRQDPEVARVVGLAVSDRLLDAAPDLVALRPLVESVSSSVISSPAAGPVVRSAAVPLHRAFTTGDTALPVLRIADIGAVAIAALKTIAPDAAAKLPDDMDVTLSQIGASGFDKQIVSTVHWVRITAWLQPMLAVLLLLGSALLREKTWAQISRTFGRAFMWLGGIIVGVILGATLASVLIPTDDIKGALTVAAWHEIDGRLWIIAALALVVGLIGHAMGGIRSIPTTQQEWIDLGHWLIRPRRATRTALAARGSLIAIIGILTVLRPLAVLAIIGSAAGLALIGWGGRDLIVAGLSWLRSAERKLHLEKATIPLAALAVVSLVIGSVAYLAWPKARDMAIVAAKGYDPKACNGHRELCDRRYNDVAYPSTHNSMSAADGNGWFIGEQPTGVMGQLRDGVRVFLVDSWYGQMSDRPPTVANTQASRADAFAAAERTYGKDVVRSALRVRDSFDLEPVGAVKPYLCHELCELGSTEWLPLMVRVKEWMRDHPREVITFMVQDKVTPEDVETLLKSAGMYDMLYTPTLGQPWPTLGEMIDSGKRLVWIHENTGGGTARPWVLPSDIWVQETPYEFKKVADFNCRPNRGAADAPLFLINHWLGNFASRIRDAHTVNSSAVLGPRLAKCRTERGQIPNFVAVDNYAIGDLFTEVDKLNGVGGSDGGN